MKVKKTKTAGPSVLSKAVTNVTKNIKKKDGKIVKKEVSKKPTKQKVNLIKKEVSDKTPKKDSAIVKKEVLDKTPKKDSAIVKKKVLDKTPKKDSAILKKKVLDKTSKKDSAIVKNKVSNKSPKKKLQIVKAEASVKAVKSNIKESIKKSPKKKKELSNSEVNRKGIMYIGHIPHGFYENEMKEYFEQFGTVTRVRVARSKKTGKSRGYGYIEFEHEDVAKIAAETMNNYLMCGRLLKACLIPYGKHHRGFFAGVPWTEKIYPKMTNRVKELKQNDSPVDEKTHKKNARRSLKKLTDLEETLKSIGIKIKFKPKNVPQ